ncbi:hypothetical protein M9H77_21347 [Catharanthus roseus]|uniref:Uncharacterized protein n=1 Tax=Catharanthus roseus TaxID=4058 RepID=A0ACC0APE0_CATRO|nr:hypothetical protein M9H77_21347 [Catharanthus roseus]
MELFEKAQTIRLRSYNDKYLIAGEDEETVYQDRNNSTKNSLWTVELVAGRDVIRLKSCYGKYLTATNIPFPPKVTGKRVIQSLPSNQDASIFEWEPIRDGFQVKLKTLWGNYLRPNGGLPPWRNSITHDIVVIPQWNRSQEKILWDVEVAESPRHKRTTPSDRSFSASQQLQNQQGMSLQDFI